MSRSFAVAILILTTAVCGTQGQEPLSSTEVNRSCPIASDSAWTPQEQFVWSQLCISGIAELKKSSAPSTDLRAAFLETILLNDKYRTLLSRRGVRIIGANFVDTVRLENVDINHDLWLQDSSLPGGADLVGMRSAHTIAFERCKIGRRLDANVLSVVGSLLLRESEFQEIQLEEAQVGKNLDLSGSKVTDLLDLSSARISGQLDLGRSTVAGKLDSENIEVGNTMFLGSGAKFQGPVDLSGAKIKNDLIFAGGIFSNEINLDRAQVGGKFVINARSVPTAISLSNFSFGSVDAGYDPLATLRQLMTVNQRYEPTLYDRFAKSYVEIPDVARSLAIEKYNAEFRHSDSVSERVFLFSAWMFWGYGYRPQYLVWWVAAFACCCALIFKTGERNLLRGDRPDSWLVFAIDAAVPGIHLNKEHEKIRFSDWRQSVLYYLRFSGAILVYVGFEYIKQSAGGAK